MDPKQESFPSRRTMLSLMAGACGAPTNRFRWVVEAEALGQTSESLSYREAFLSSKARLTLALVGILPGQLLRASNRKGQMEVDGRHRKGCEVHKHHKILAVVGRISDFVGAG